MGRGATYRLLGLMVSLLFCATVTVAQSGFYVPRKGKIFFKGDTATVFSNVTNAGSIGIAKKAVVNFKGQRWTNEADAELVGELNATDAGMVRFMAKDWRQQLEGGYNAATKSGPAFHHLQLANPHGLELLNSSAKVGGQIDLTQGLFYLNGQTLAVGNGRPGAITGYDSSRYFVTSGGGLLLREGLNANAGQVVFPIGSRAGSYTPAGVNLKSGATDDFFASVSDGVRSGNTTGSLLTNESVNKTWQIGKRNRPDEGEVEIDLQHLNGDEGMLFAANRHRSYVSRFANGAWDIGQPQALPSPGHLTTSAPLGNSGTNSRVFAASVGAVSYFTKLTTAKGDTSKTRLWFNAYRIDPSNVKVYWYTRPEVNIRQFVVQRRLANESAFRNVDSVDSKANGYSQQQLNYETNDPNGYKGISFYRVMLVSYGGDTTYSDIVAVGNRAGVFNSDLWPNPTSGRFYISLNTQQPIRKVVLWDVLGQKLMEQDTRGLRVVQIDAIRYAAGNYYLSLIGMTGSVVETKKVIIVR